MPANVTNVKNAISTALGTLVSGGTLGAKIVDDLKNGIFDLNFPAYPCAVLTPPSTESKVYTNAQVYRTYVFNIVIVMKGENITTTTAAEELSETILDAFDHDPTLGGVCQELEATASPVEAATSRSGSYLAFAVTLRAKSIKQP